MTRPSLRRTPMLESLEIRQVLSTLNVVGTTPDQQYALSLINLVRTNPAAAASKFTANISPDVQATLNQYGLSTSNLKAELGSAASQPALAWSDALGDSAQGQSQYEADNGVQTHQGQGELGLNDRITAAGYGNATTYGENTYSYASSVDEAMQSFLFDWGVPDHGHYNNILQPGTSPQAAYSEVGIGLVNTSNKGVGPVVITQDFGTRQNEAPEIIGVVYNDPNNTGFYSVGQGQGGVSIDAENLSTGKVSSTKTWGSGGFQEPVDPNADYQVTATENGHVISSQKLHVGDVNATTADFVHDPSKDQAPVPTPAPVPAPAPTPAPAPPTGKGSSGGSPTQSAEQVLAPTPTHQDHTAVPDQAESTFTVTNPTSPSPSPTPTHWASTWLRWKAPNASHSQS